MKPVFAFVSLVLAATVSVAAPTPPRTLLPTEPIEQCLELTKVWAYRNMGIGQAQAARHAIDFCGAGGRSSCLEPAHVWIHRNLGGSPAAAAQLTLAFCRRGDVACLEPTKAWIYRNTGVSPAQAAREAIDVCADRLSCSPIEGAPVRPAPRSRPLPLQ